MPPTPPSRPWPARVPTVLWAPLTAAGLVIEVGVLGIIANQPWLYPSLGPSALVQAEFPSQQAARFRDVVLGHAIGLGAGLLAVWLVGADASTPVTAGALSAERVLAAALAIAGTILGLVVLRVSQPPAASTTLVVALGGLRPTLHDVVAVLVGALLLGASGEVVRRVRLRGTQQR
jgi:hypothetical protein